MFQIILKLISSTFLLERKKSDVEVPIISHEGKVVAVINFSYTLC